MTTLPDRLLALHVRLDAKLGAGFIDDVTSEELTALTEAAAALSGGEAVGHVTDSFPLPNGNYLLEFVAATRLQEGAPLFTTPPAPVAVRRLIAAAKAAAELMRDLPALNGLCGLAVLEELSDALASLDGQPAGVDAGANVRSYAEGDRVAWTSRLGKKFEGTVLVVIEPVSTRYEVALNDGTYVCAFGSDLAALGGGGGES